LSEKISAGMNSPQATVEVGSGCMRSDTSFFLDILESLCPDILDGIFLDWIWPFAWTYFVDIVAELSLDSHGVGPQSRRAAKLTLRGTRA
jgi:hypothetical protein